MNTIEQNLEKFSGDPAIESLESLAFFLIIAAGVFMLHRWLSKKEPKETIETVEEQ